jgi:hypothetical protein
MRASGQTVDGQTPAVVGLSAAGSLSLLWSHLLWQLVEVNVYGCSSQVDEWVVLFTPLILVQAGIKSISQIRKPSLRLAITPHGQREPGHRPTCTWTQLTSKPGSQSLNLWHTGSSCPQNYCESLLARPQGPVLWSLILGTASHPQSVHIKTSWADKTING